MSLRDWITKLRGKTVTEPTPEPDEAEQVEQAQEEGTAVIKPKLEDNQPD